jgi:hypothetical protein
MIDWFNMMEKVEPRLLAGSISADDWTGADPPSIISQVLLLPSFYKDYILTVGNISLN